MADPKPKNGSKKQLNWRQAAAKVGGKAGPMPDVKPQLCTLINKPFDREGWLFEIKWDGYRTLAFKDISTRLVSRGGKSFNRLYPQIKEAVSKLPLSVILDGEIVALDEQGRSSFNELQNNGSKAANVVYYVFDLLYLSTMDLREVPLIERKAMLKGLLEAADDRLRYTDHIETEGLAFFDAVKAAGLEGMVAKDPQAAYRSGERTLSWQKVKAETEEEFVIVGFTEPESFAHFDRLILARRTKAGLHYGGRVGNGIDPRTRRKLRELLHALRTKRKPFPESPDWEGKRPVWVKPELRCTVAYVETTPNGNLRHATFRGLLG